MFGFPPSQSEGNEMRGSGKLREELSPIHQPIVSHDSSQLNRETVVRPLKHCPTLVTTVNPPFISGGQMCHIRGIKRQISQLSPNSSKQRSATHITAPIETHQHRQTAPNIIPDLKKWPQVSNIKPIQRSKTAVTRTQETEEKKKSSTKATAAQPKKKRFKNSVRHRLLRAVCTSCFGSTAVDLLIRT